MVTVDELKMKYPDANAWQMGDSPELANELAALIKKGIKTASCGSYASYQKEEFAPRIGSYNIILNGQDVPVCVARGVDDVDTGLGELLLGTSPVAGGGGGGDGDAALLLLRHPVHGGGAVMGLTDLVVDAGVVEDALGGSGLAGVDVSHDADVSGIL